MTEEVEGGMDILKDPSRLYNADESGFPLCPKTSKVLTMRGSKQVYNFSSSDKTQITVLACTSATAHYIPPMIVYPGVRFKYNPLEGFEDAILGRSINGWMDSDLFLTWLRETFLPHIKARKVSLPVVLFVDGHSTHISLEANEFSRRENFVMYCLQQHASHIMQPLDLCLFSSLKYNWRKSVRTYQMENPGETVTKAVFAKDLKRQGFSPYKPSAVIENPKLGPSCLFPEFKHDPLPVTSTVNATVDDNASIVSSVLPFTVTATDDDNASIVSTVLPSTVTVTVDDNASSATVDDNASIVSTVLPSTVTAAVDDNASIVTVSTVLPTCHIENIPTARPTIEIANVSTAEVEAVEAEIPTLISHTQSISETSVSKDSFAKFLQLPKA
ncbi:unnamed protein product [Mytilus edulis]|uniref:DDE-1 domain-containing protein n=1 Tax=Mytilus edulis TaxID=6550 RepID=A0A8S3PU13_MYTED|nr:unnamed protein product [Mytilus edulis]